MEHLIIDNVVRFGYAAVFVLMVAESACIPVPSEVTMLFGGALANAALVARYSSHHQLNFVLVGLVGTLGNLTGSLLAYWVGRAGGRPLIERWGRLVFLRQRELDRAEEWFAEHGEAAVFVSRLLPVVRTFISLPAGVAEMPLGRFVVYTVAGCLPWTFALAGVGYALGGSWGTVERYFRPVSWAVAGAVALAIGWWLLTRARRRRREIRGATSRRG